MLYREIPMTKQKSIHPAEELPDRYYLIWIVLINLMHSTFSLRLLKKNTWDTTFNDYFGEKYDSNAVLLQIFHTTDGKVVAINFGKDGYMVTIVPGKETTCVYNGKSLKSIRG